MVQFSWSLSSDFIIVKEEYARAVIGARHVTIHPWSCRQLQYRAAKKISYHNQGYIVLNDDICNDQNVLLL